MNALSKAIEDMIARISSQGDQIKQLTAQLANGQEPRAWETFDGEGGYDFRLFAENETYYDDYIKRNGEKYSTWVVPLYTHSAPAQQPTASEQEPVATVVKNGASRQWMSERLGKFPDGIYSLYTHPSPAQQPLSEAYEKGWREAAKWARREDLFCDIGSLAYLEDMAASLRLIDECPTKHDLLTKKVQPLSEAQIHNADPHSHVMYDSQRIEFARAIEAAHGIKEKP